MYQIALIYTNIDFDFDSDSEFDIFRAITVTLKTVLNFTVVSNSTNMKMTTLFSNMAVQMA